MPESENSSHRVVSEILKSSYEILVELSQDIRSDRESLRQYIQAMRQQSPGLTKQIGAWVGLLRGSIPEHGLSVALRAEGAFTAGSAMMYELLRRVAEKRDYAAPEADFIHDNLVDSELHSERPEWLIELSFRGEKLLNEHPAFFDIAIEMFARNNGGHDVGEVKEMLFAPPDPSDLFSFDLVHYLNGAAEIVLPVERRAEVLLLEQ